MLARSAASPPRVVELAVLFLAHTEERTTFFPSHSIPPPPLLVVADGGAGGHCARRQREEGREEGRTDLGPMKEGDEARVPREQRSGAARRREKKKTRLPTRGKRFAKCNLKCRR